MKRIFFAILLTIALLTTSNPINAQAWSKDTKLLGVGLGASYFFHIDRVNNANSVYGNAPLIITGQLNFQGEFGVHDYVGVGFTTGLGGRAGYARSFGYYYGYYGLSYGSKGSVNFPIGALANFHFYQLIADKTGKNIHADKLDIYAGVSVGTGVSAAFYNNESTHVYPIAFGGVHVGARYYFTDKLGANLELGFGKSIVNGGIVFKL